MANTSFMQTTFLGGQWSPFARGRAEDPRYKTAMKVCFNGLPLEEGAWVRRPGTRHLAVTPGGNPARVLPFDFTETSPFLLEFSDDVLRLYQGLSLVLQDDLHDVLSITAGSPSVVQTAPNGWSTGTVVTFLPADADLASDYAVLRNRQFSITVSTDGTFTLADPVTGAAVNGVGWNPKDQVQVARVLVLSTPYSAGSWANVRVVQTLNANPLQPEVDLVYIIGGGQPVQQVAPVLLQGPHQVPGQFTPFTITQAPQTDGPYLDPVAGTQVGPAALSGAFQLTFSYVVWQIGSTYFAGDVATYSGINYVSLQSGNLGNEPDTTPTYWAPVVIGTAFSAQGAGSADVGRSVRLFSEPPAWNPLTAYSPGDNVVLRQGGDAVGRTNYGYYTCLAGNTGVEPDSNLADWQLSTTNYQWVWGTIVSVQTPNIVTIQLRSGALLYSNPILTWRLGAYGGANGYPTCGCWHDGRLWLGGALPNRIDSSQPDAPTLFSPTGPDGTVSDANGITRTFNSGDSNAVVWMKPHAQGIVCGTKSGEWLVQANSTGDPLTPTNIQDRRITKYGGANIEPVDAELTLVFVHKFKRRLLEMFSDVFTGRFAAPNMNELSKDMTETSILELARQQELAPIIWGRRGDGGLVGTTYRRISAFSTEKPLFNAWHKHALGSGRAVASICAGPTPDGSLETLAMVTKSQVPDMVSGTYHVEQMTNIFDEENTGYQAWFLDNAVTPSGMAQGTAAGVSATPYTGMWLFGLQHLAGQKVTAWIAGLDCGDYTVAPVLVEAPPGSGIFVTRQERIFVPYGSDPDRQFTYANMQAISSATTFGDFGVPLDTVTTATAVRTPAQGQVWDYTATAGIAVFGTSGPIVDWAGQYAYIFNAGNAGNDYLNQVNLNTGALVQRVSANGLGAGVWTNYPFAIGSDGNIYNCNSVLNADVYNKISSVNLTLLAQGGTQSSTFGPDIVHWPKPSSLLGLQCAGTNYLLSIGGTSSVFALNTDQMKWTGFNGTIDQSYSGANESRGTLAAGPVGPTSASAFVLVHPGLGIGASFTQPIAFYRLTIESSANGIWQVAGTAYAGGTTYLVGAAVTYSDLNYVSLANANVGNTPNSSPTWWKLQGNPGITSVELGTLTPAQVDPTWPSFQTIANFNMLYDPLDGNLIFGVNTLASVVHQSYIVKINPSTMAILWKAAVPNLMPGYTSRLGGGTLCFLYNSTIYTINTQTGHVSTYAAPGITQNSSGGTWEIYDSTTGALLVAMDYNGAVAGGPLAQGGTPQVFSGQPARITLGSFLQGTVVTSSSRLVIPAVVGFTYTSQGQLLTPIVQQDSGAQMGPGFGKKKRHHQYAALFHNTQGVSVGTNFSNLKVATFASDDGGAAPNPLNQLFSGTWWATLGDDYGRDQSLCWQVTRPYPVSIAAIGGFIQTQDM